MDSGPSSSRGGKVDYDPQDDPLEPELRRWASNAGTTDDPERLAAEIRRFFPVVPLGNLLRHLDEAGTKQHVEGVLSPYVDEEVGIYMHSLALDESEKLELPTAANLPFSMLWIGDPLTGLHSVDVGVATGFVAEAMGRVGARYAVQTPLLRSAGFTHDLGKGHLPRVILENPVPRIMNPIIFGWKFGDPTRFHKMEAPFELTAEEQERFQGLLDAKSFDPDLVRAFAELCIQRRGDWRASISLGSVLEFCGYLIHERQFPSDIKGYTAKHLGKEERAELGHMLKVLRTQRGDFEQLNWVLARAGIDPTVMTLLDAIQLHEVHSFGFVPPEVGCIVSRHHDYLTTQATLKKKEGYLPEPEENTRWALILADIMMALAERRHYFINGEPKPLHVLPRILHKEAVERHGIPGELVEGVIADLIPEGDSKDSLRAIFTQAQKRRAA